MRASRPAIPRPCSATAEARARTASLQASISRTKAPDLEKAPETTRLTVPSAVFRPRLHAADTARSRASNRESVANLPLLRFYCVALLAARSASALRRARCCRRNAITSLSRDSAPDSSCACMLTLSRFASALTPSSMSPLAAASSCASCVCCCSCRICALRADNSPSRTSRRSFSSLSARAARCFSFSMAASAE